ncbi:MAG: hypothetical protein ABI624_17125 [Casimicrobiaceae bacterium]
MSDAPESVAAAERELLQAKARLVSEYRALETTWRRRARSPSLIGSLLVTALVIGYLVTGKRANAKAAPGNSTTWTRVLQLGPVLVPVLQMLRVLQAGMAAIPPTPDARGADHGDQRREDGRRS